jgi:Ca-activated chloride channel family protein
MKENVKTKDQRPMKRDQRQRAKDQRSFTLVVGHWSFIMFLFFQGNPLIAQNDYLLLRSGDELYRTRQFDQAETMYRKANEAEQKPTTQYNLGNSVYQQNRLPEAVEAYKKAIASATDPLLKSKAHYNLGNAHFQQQQFEESVRAYKDALKLNPEDVAAKKNLVLAMRQLKQQQQQKQEQQQQQQQEQQDQDQDQDKEEQSQQQQQQQKQKQSATKEDVNDKEAKEILKAIEREDQRVQGKLKKTDAGKSPPVKDW